MCVLCVFLLKSVALCIQIHLPHHLKLPCLHDKHVLSLMCSCSSLMCASRVYYEIQPILSTLERMPCTKDQTRNEQRRQRRRVVTPATKSLVFVRCDETNATKKEHTTHPHISQRFTLLADNTLLRRTWMMSRVWSLAEHRCMCVASIKAFDLRRASHKSRMDRTSYVARNVNAIMACERLLAINCKCLSQPDGRFLSDMYPKH